MNQIKHLIKFLIEDIKDYRSYILLKRFQKNLSINFRSEHNCIKVLFICQMPQLWAKMKPVYEAMRKSEDFVPFILAVPDNIKIPQENQSYSYLSKDYVEVINAATVEGWYNIKDKGFEYIFYQRPYDVHLPEQYRSNQTIKFSKICYIAYGFLLSKTNEKLCMDRAFFRNIYLYFAENEYVKKININRFPKSHEKMVRKSVYVGYPALTDMQEAKKSKLNKDENHFDVMWTPRWTTNVDLGYSNFFRFKDNIIDYFKKHSDCNLRFRPHPLMFDNFIKTGEMTKEEVKKYKEEFGKHLNMIFDESAEYFSMFWNSDILITDISSIIIEYFLTGKPIIYCESGIEPNDFTKEILEVCYYARNWNEVENYLEMIKNGNDGLSEKRKKAVESFSKYNDLNTPYRVMEIIKKDSK